MNLIKITVGQVKQITLDVSKRWEFKNHNSYYNCIDNKTGQQSNDGGNYNFAHYHFQNFVEYKYLQMINKNSLYLDWQTVGVDNSNSRKTYIKEIQYKVVELLCGFKQKKTVENF